MSRLLMNTGSIMYSISNELLSDDYLDEEVELSWVIGCSNDLFCSKTPGKSFRPIQNTLLTSENRYKETREQPGYLEMETITLCQVSWQTLTWALQSLLLPSFCYLPPPCRHPRASSRTPRSAPVQYVFIKMVKRMYDLQVGHSHGIPGCQLAPTCCRQGPPIPSTSQGTQPCLKVSCMK